MNSCCVISKLKFGEEAGSISYTGTQALKLLSLLHRYWGDKHMYLSPLMKDTELAKSHACGFFGGPIK